MTPDNAEAKERQKLHWDTVAEGWAAWHDWTEHNFAPLTAWFQTAAAWPTSARVLDVASGAGYPALATARAMRAHGRVMATDISDEMVAVTATQAAARGLANVECAPMDAEALRLDDATFESVMNAFGLMFCPDPSRALQEAHRVLARDGRIAVATGTSPHAARSLP